MPAPIRRGYADTAVGQIHYRRAPGERPLVLLHQSSSSSAMWEPVLPALAARGIDAIAFDTPGYGNSTPPSAPTDLKFYVDRVVEAATSLGIRNFDLMGHHTGATIALAVAAAHPDRVRRVVVWGIPMMEQRFMDRMANETTPPLDPSGEAIAVYWRWRRSLTGDTISIESTIARTFEMLEAGPTRHYSHNVVGRTDHATLLKQVGQPVLVLSGERDVLWDCTLAASPLLTNGRFKAITGASLDVVDEQPAALVAEIAGFLNEDP